MTTTHAICHILLCSIVLGVCAHQRRVTADDSAGKHEPLTTLDLVIVYTTTTERLPLVHATRPARRNIRTFIAVESESAAAQLNQQHGGAAGEHRETYISWPDADSSAGTDADADDSDSGGGADSRNVSSSSGGGGGPYGANPPLPTHPLHRMGRRWAMAPLLAHELLVASSNASSSSSESRISKASTVVETPYKWMLIGRDDTLWLPRRVAALLAPLGAHVTAAVSDHLVDFNGRRLLAPSPVPAVCVPCGLNLTAFFGRRRPPLVPAPACPVCRPAAGCEFRFNRCHGLAGGEACGSRRFLGSADRCPHSWAAGGGGVALSAALIDQLSRDQWRACVRGAGTTSGERALGRCLWRLGYAVTHPAAGLAAGLTRDPLAPHLALFGNPLARKSVFGARADQLLAPGYAAAEAAAKEAAAKAAAAASTTAPTSEAAAAATAAIGLLASTRVAAKGAATECDAACATWVRQNAVSAHLDVPYLGAGGAPVGAANIAAAAAVMEEAARGVAKEAGGGGGR